MNSRFIKLTLQGMSSVQASNSVVLINVDHISTLQNHGSGTAVKFSFGYVIHVQETMEEIENRLWDL